MYTTYVRPHLEYCASTWNPYLVRDIEDLEKVQKRATKLVKGYEKLPYEQRLKSLGIYTLFCRCQRGDLIEVFKILNRYYDINPTQFLNHLMLPALEAAVWSFSSHMPDLRICSNFFFTQRVIGSWNSLPDNVVEANTIESFKFKLDEYWRSQGHGYEQGL